jgi:plasmid stabilization system protein ParE
MRVVVSARAKADVLNIYSYLVDCNPAAAERTLQRIEDKIEQLSHFPCIGVARNRLAADVRAVVVGTHLILYKIEADAGALIILRIIDGRMDVEEEFRR